MAGVRCITKLVNGRRNQMNGKLFQNQKKIFKPLVKEFQKGTRKILPKQPRYYPESGLIVPPPSQKKSKKHLYGAKGEEKGKPIEKKKKVFEKERSL